jgi:hypothetical protein
MVNKRSEQTLKRRAKKKLQRVLANKTQAGQSPLNTLQVDFVEAAEVGSGLPKLSAQIFEYAQPLTDAAADVAQQIRAVENAIMCWNSALVPLGKGMETIARELHKHARGDQKLERDLVRAFEEMVARKRKLFGDDRRFVVDFAVTDTPDGLHLLVASTVIPPEQQTPASPHRSRWASLMAKVRLLAHSNRA